MKNLFLTHWITCLAHKPTKTDAIWIPMHGGHIQFPTMHLQYVRMRFWRPNVWQTCCEYLLVSISHFVPVHEPANGGAVSIPHIDETSSETHFDLLISPVFNVREKAISSFTSLRRNSSWLIGASLPVKYATANLAFTSISAITKVKTRSFQSFVVIDSSNEESITTKDWKECLRLLWSSTWWRYIK